MTPEEFVAAEAEKSFSIGVSDCCTTVDAWLRASGMGSPLMAAGADADTAKQLAADGRGMIRAVLIGMRRAGCAKTEAPRVGDVGLIRRNGMVGAAIMGTTHWLIRSEHGVSGVTHGMADVMRAWSVE